MADTRLMKPDLKLPFLTTPVLGFAGFSGSGKTTLLCRLIPLLRQQGLRLGLLKHSHHRFEIDRPGKDSFLLRHAGARQVVLASRRRTVVFAAHPAGAAGQPSAGLSASLQRLDDPGLDLILVEGYKHAALAKLEIHRPRLGHPLLALADGGVIAVACDRPPQPRPVQPLLDLNDPAAIGRFILELVAAQSQ